LQAGEIEVTDSRHPLFGRKFAVVSRSKAAAGMQHDGHVFVVYRDRVLLRLPVSATSLVSQLHTGASSKLTREAIEALIALIEEITSARCTCGPKASGSSYQKPSGRRSSKISPRSSQR